jgi:hypothetical protein
MGKAADRKVTEIDEARRQLEVDLRELEDRMPRPIRSMKVVAGVLLGLGAIGAVLLRRLRSRRRNPSAEVVVRIVREDR